MHYLSLGHPSRTFLLSLRRTINYPNLAFLLARETRQALVNMSSSSGMGSDLGCAVTHNLQRVGLYTISAQPLSKQTRQSIMGYIARINSSDLFLSKLALVKTHWSNVVAPAVTDSVSWPTSFLQQTYCWKRQELAVSYLCVAAWFLASSVTSWISFCSSISPGQRPAHPGSFPPPGSLCIVGEALELM